MNRPGSLIRFRRSAVLHLVAVWLLVLAVSPFTPPFSTCELGVLSGNVPISADLLSSDKKLHDDVVTGVVSQAVTPELLGIFLPPHAIARAIESRRVLPLVLRL